MKELYFEACEEARDQSEGEPPESLIEALYQDRLDRLYDAADNARKAARERGE